MNCFFHEDTPAVASCSECRKATCRECSITLEGRMFCPQCVHSVGVQAGTKAKSENTRGIVAAIIGGTVVSIVSIASVAHAGTGMNILAIPLVFLIEFLLGGLYFWCCYWGMPVVWRGMTRMSFFMIAPLFAWILFLVVGIELFFAISFLVGLFRGVMRFSENKKIIANSKIMMDEMEVLLT